MNHPNIETIYEFADQDGVDFLVMELIPGHALNDKIKEGPLPLPEVARLGIQLPTVWPRRMTAESFTAI